MSTETLRFEFETLVSLDVRSHTHKHAQCLRTGYLCTHSHSQAVSVDEVPMSYLIVWLSRSNVGGGGGDGSSSVGFPAVAFNKTDFAVSPQE